MLDWTAALKVLSISAIPFLELRVGIPVGISEGLPPWVAIGLGVAGNLVQVPMVLAIMFVLRRLALQAPWAAQWIKRVDAMAESHHHQVRRFGWVGLALLVGIPIPGTGLWTGAAVASLARLPLGLAVMALAIGVAVSGLLIGGIATGAFAVIRNF